MKLIVSGIFSVIGLLLVFIINLTKGKGIVGVLVAPIIAAPIIFGVVFGVLMLLSKILKVDLILEEKNELETKEAVNTFQSNASVGKNVNFTVSDDIDSTENFETSSGNDDISEESGNDKLPEINSDRNLDFPDLDDDGGADSAETETQATVDDLDSYENFSMKKITPGLPPEEIIKDKIGVAATPEEIAKGIKTILKRQGGLAGDD